MRSKARIQVLAFAGSPIPSKVGGLWSRNSFTTSLSTRGGGGGGLGCITLSSSEAQEEGSSFLTLRLGGILIHFTRVVSVLIQTQNSDVVHLKEKFNSFYK